MHKQTVGLVVIASLLVGGFAFNALAASTSRGRTLEQRVTALEASAERQRRAIESLREESADQQQQIRRLLRFRTETNERLQALDRRTSKLGGQGLYSGPIDNGQIELGADPVACAGQVAEWNGAGTSLGCVPSAP
jgi:outer membrane murein-binding lipoprotein Lpp